MTQNIEKSYQDGDYGQNLCEDLFNHLQNKMKMTRWVKTPHTMYSDIGLKWERDYVFHYKDGTNHGVEVKSPKGNTANFSYPTTVIETWKDDDQAIRPAWWRAQDANQLKYIFFVNRSKNTVHIFDSKKLQDWIKINVEGPNPTVFETKCLDGNEADKGWIVKVEWENKNAGWIATYFKENVWQPINNVKRGKV
jgi:hypothetical protein